MVHGASDNQSTQARRVLHTHYFPVLDEEVDPPSHDAIAAQFHPAHLAAMDDRFRHLIGLP
jgi:hypothetical protein